MHKRGSLEFTCIHLLGASYSVNCFFIEYGSNDVRAVSRNRLSISNDTIFRSSINSLVTSIELMSLE